MRRGKCRSRGECKLVLSASLFDNTYISLAFTVWLVNRNWQGRKLSRRVESLRAWTEYSHVSGNVVEILTDGSNIRIFRKYWNMCCCCLCYRCGWSWKWRWRCCFCIVVVVLMFCFCCWCWWWWWWWWWWLLCCCCFCCLCCCCCFCCCCCCCCCCWENKTLSTMISRKALFYDSPFLYKVTLSVGVGSITELLCCFRSSCLLVLLYLELSYGSFYQ